MNRLGKFDRSARQTCSRFRPGETCDRKLGLTPRFGPLYMSSSGLIMPSPHYSRGVLDETAETPCETGVRSHERGRHTCNSMLTDRSGEPARRQACPSGVLAVAVEAFVKMWAKVA